MEALEEYVESGVQSFHVPGHQQGLGAPPGFRLFLERHGWQADITQVLGMDDIHRPHSVCGQAQQLAAACFGAERTYFLVNGSTVGNQAMLMSALRPGDLVLMARNAHRSAIGGLLLCGARAAYFSAPFDPEMGVHGAPTVEIVESALQQHPQAKAVFLTSPTYYGAVSPIQELVDLVHRNNRIALVDEAWGAHLGFHPDFPASAVRAGADLVVQSTHKLLSGLTQCAMLHANGQRIEVSRLEATLRLLQSTSPSCLLVASLDATRRQMATRGRAICQQVLDLSRQLRAELESLPGLRCFGGTDRSSWDPTRLTLSATSLGYSGYQLETYLREQHNIQVELSDLKNIVVVLTAGHQERHTRRLVSALKALKPRSGEGLGRSAGSLPEPRILLTLQEAFQAEQEHVSGDQVVGRISAEMITTYPPGIPVICPGEAFSPEVLESLLTEHRAGSRIEGAADPTLNTFRVVK